MGNAEVVELGAADGVLAAIRSRPRGTPKQGIPFTMTREVFSHAPVFRVG